MDGSWSVTSRYHWTPLGSSVEEHQTSILLQKNSTHSLSNETVPLLFPVNSIPHPRLDKAAGKSDALAVWGSGSMWVLVVLMGDHLWGWGWIHSSHAGGIFGNGDDSKALSMDTAYCLSVGHWPGLFPQGIKRLFLLLYSCSAHIEDSRLAYKMLSTFSIFLYVGRVHGVRLHSSDNHPLDGPGNTVNCPFPMWGVKKFQFSLISVHSSREVRNSNMYFCLECWLGCSITVNLYNRHFIFTSLIIASMNVAAMH